MRLLIGLLSAMLSFTSCASTSGRVVELSSLIKIYERDQPVELTIKNISQEEIRVYCDLDAIDEETGEWVAWPFRPEDGRTDVISVIYPLKSGGSTGVIFDVRKISLPPIPLGQMKQVAEKVTFRFRVVVLRAKTDETVAELYSDSFAVMHPFERAQKTP